MQPEIKTLSEKKLVGKRIRMSFISDKTHELWQGFIPHRKEISKVIGQELYSVEVYAAQYFENFNPAQEFDKWACVEVMDFESVPVGMETLILPGGLYAVFVYTGPASKGASMYHYIFESWLPNSEYWLDDRPHFAVMGEKYKREASDSEEEIWIPVRSEKLKVKS